MLGYTAGSKDIPDCANDYIVTIPIHIGDDGVNTKSHLQYINLAYATDQKQLNSLGVQKTGKKIWRTVRVMNICLLHCCIASDLRVKLVCVDWSMVCPKHHCTG